MALINGYQERHTYDSGRFSNIAFQDVYQIERSEPKGVLQRLGLRGPQRRFDSLCDVLSNMEKKPKGTWSDRPVDLEEPGVVVKVTQDDKGRNKAVKVTVYHAIDLSDGDYKGYHKTIGEFCSTPAKKEKLERAKSQFLGTSDRVHAIVQGAVGKPVGPEKTITYWDLWKMTD